MKGPQDRGELRNISGSPQKAQFPVKHGHRARALRFKLTFSFNTFSAPGGPGPAVGHIPEGGAGEQNLFVDPTAEMPSAAACGGVTALVAVRGEPMERSSTDSGGPICVCAFFLCKVLVVSRLAQELDMDVGILVTGAEPLCAQETGPATFSVLTMVPMV